MKQKSVKPKNLTELAAYLAEFVKSKQQQSTARPRKMFVPLKELGRNKNPTPVPPNETPQQKVPPKG